MANLEVAHLFVNPFGANHLTRMSILIVVSSAFCNTQPLSIDPRKGIHPVQIRSPALPDVPTTCSPVVALHLRKNKTCHDAFDIWRPRDAPAKGSQQASQCHVEDKGGKGPNKNGNQDCLGSQQWSWRANQSPNLQGAAPANATFVCMKETRGSSQPLIVRRFWPHQIDQPARALAIELAQKRRKTASQWERKRKHSNMRHSASGIIIKRPFGRETFIVSMGKISGKRMISFQGRHVKATVSATTSRPFPTKASSVP